MAYRDPCQAARLRAERHRDDVALRAERIAVELVPQLPKELRERLEQLERRAMAEGDDLDSWARIEGDIGALGEVVDEVIELAPRISQRFNRQPRGFPPREQAPGLPLFDIYDDRLKALRDRFHDALHELDPEAELHDASPRYFDRMERPFLVEASFRTAGHPLRLQVVATQQQSNIAANSLAMQSMRFGLRALVRRSTPPLRVQVSWLHSLKVLLRLKHKQKTTTGDERIDSRLAVEALQADAQRAFTPGLRTALWQLLEDGRRPVLRVQGGHARLEWQRQDGKVDALRAAIAVMVALRELKPVPLIRRQMSTPVPE